MEPTPRERIAAGGAEATGEPGSTCYNRGFIVHNEQTTLLAQHGMLAIGGSPVWRTVADGSRGYVVRAAKSAIARHVPAGDSSGAK
jgi:hypothetical protein